MTRYIRLSIKGKLGSTEVWSVNPVFDPAGEIPAAYDQAKGDASVAAVGALALPSILEVGLSAAGSITGIRLEMRDTDSPVMLGLSEYTLPTPKVGTNSAQCPPQTSVVCSLRTATPTARGRGRLYWPALALPVDGTTLRIQAASVTSLAAGFRTYLTSIRTALNTAWFPGGPEHFDLAVYSPTDNTCRPVTTLQVGNTFDTQRRRRDALAESYTSLPYP